MLQRTFPLTVIFVLSVALALIPRARDRSIQLRAAATATPTTQSNLAIINAGNAKRLKEVGRLGYGMIDQLAWSPDGQMLAVSGLVGIEVYSRTDLSKPLQFIEFASRDRPSTFLHNKSMFSSDDNKVAFLNNATLVASDGNELAIWDIKTGQHGAALPSSAKAIAVSPDGRMIAIVDDSGLRLWFPGAVKTPITLTAETGIQALRFLQEGKVLISDSLDLRVSLWDTVTYDKMEISLQEPHCGGPVQVYQSAFSPDGNWFAVTGFGGTCIWNLRTGEGQRLGDVMEPAKSRVAFSYDSKTLAVGTSNGGIEFWDTKTRKENNYVVDKSGVEVFALSHSPDGKILASGSSDGIIRLRDIQSGQLTDEIKNYSWAIAALAFSPDSKILVGATVDATAWRWDIDSKELLSIGYGNKYGVGYGTLPYDMSVTISSNARLIATGTSIGGDIWLWRPTGESRGLLQTSTPSDVFKMVFSQDAATLAAAVGPDLNTLIYFWDVQTGKRSNIWKIRDGRVSEIAFDPTGTVLAIGMESGTIVMRDVKTANGLVTFRDVSGPVGIIRFNPDGTMFASSIGEYDGTDFVIRLWDIRSRKQTLLVGHTDFINGMAFCPDGTLLASSSNDDTIRLWDVKTGALLSTLKSNIRDSGYLIFSPDGRLIASANSDGTVRLWGVIP